MNLFEQATRNKLRFASAKGLISTEDLWTLDLKALDFMAAELHNELQQKQVSFLKSKRNKTDTLLQLKFDVVTYIMSVKEAEAEAKEVQASIKAEEQRLLELINRKENEVLEQLDIEALKKRLAELQK